MRWSPDSKTLAFAYASAYFLEKDRVRLISIEENTIKEHRDIPAKHLLDLLWSPDSNQLLFAQGEVEGLFGYQISTTKSIYLPITYDDRLVPVLSPTGQQLVLLKNKTPEELGLYLVNQDGSHLVEIPRPAELSKESVFSSFAHVFLGAIKDLILNWQATRRCLKRAIYS